MGRKTDRLLPSWLLEAKKENVKAMLEGVKTMNRKTLFNLFKGAALTDFPCREEIKSINIPSLILGWTGDQSHPIETAIELNELMPQSELHIAQGYSDLKTWPQLI